MYILKTQASFDSAHFLFGYDGKCSNIHGHTWKISAEIAADKLDQSGQYRGMVVDFGDFKRELKNVADDLDHTLLYESGSLKTETEETLIREGFSLKQLDFRPTAENLAKYIFDKLHTSKSTNKL